MYDIAVDIRVIVCYNSYNDWESTGELNVAVLHNESVSLNYIGP